jgi:hypothetical protein
VARFYLNSSSISCSHIDSALWLSYGQRRRFPSRMVGCDSSKLVSGHLSISRAPLDRNAVVVLPSLYCFLVGICRHVSTHERASRAMSILGRCSKRTPDVVPRQAWHERYQAPPAVVTATLCSTPGFPSGVVPHDQKRQCPEFEQRQRVWWIGEWWRAGDRSSTVLPGAIPIPFQQHAPRRWRNRRYSWSRHSTHMNADDASQGAVHSCRRAI